MTFTAVGARRRLALAAASVGVVAGVALSSPVSAGGPAASSMAPSGQRLALLTHWSFASSDGWTPLGPTGALVEATTASGGRHALAVTSAGPRSGAGSGRFPVVAGDRYFAGGWTSAETTGRHVGLGFRFYGAGGRRVPQGTVLGQGSVDDTGGWTPLHPADAVAPPRATSAEVLFVVYDAPPGEVQLLDDVTVRHASGSPAPVAGPLHTAGPHVVDARGRVVMLRGIAISGLERPPSQAVPVTTAEVVAAHRWGANLIRLPLAENPVLPGDCAHDPSYLPRVDRMVSAITRRGMVALLDLHTNAVAPCAPTVQHPMPDVGAVTFWKIVAKRYEGNPLVAFDLFNEPYDVSDRVWHDGGTVISHGVTYVVTGMHNLYQAVRSTGATNLVVASGTNWATDFPWKAPLTNTMNLVYAVHAYTCPHGPPSSGAVCTGGPGGPYDPSGILDRFRAVASTVPVMVTEFGWPDRDDGTYLPNVIGYVEKRYWAGWSAWAFDGTTRNAFDLVRDTGPASEPAPTGMAVIAGLVRD